MTVSELQIGPQTAADGSTRTLRGDKTSAGVVTDGHGRYVEPTYRGGVYSLDSDSVTLAAANTTKGALGTIKLVNGFYNPVGSGKLACILAARVTSVSGTPAGGFFFNYITGITVNSATTGSVKSAYLGGSASSAMLAAVNVVLTALGAPTTAMVQLESIGGPAAIAAGAGEYDAFTPVDGRIIVPPGAVFGIAATGAGTTHIVQSTLVWEEIAL